MVGGHVCKGWRDVVGSTPGGKLLSLSCAGDSMSCLPEISNILDLIWRNSRSRQCNFQLVIRCTYVYSCAALVVGLIDEVFTTGTVVGN